MATIIGELIPLAAFIFLGAVILVPFYLRHQERMKMQDIVRSSVEQGHSAPTELIQALQLRGNGRLPASPSAICGAASSGSPGRWPVSRLRASPIITTPPTTVRAS